MGFRALKNELGVGLLVTSLVIVAVGLAGLEVTEMAASDSANSASETNSKISEAAATAGVESARYSLSQGLDPTKTFDLDESQVDIITDPQNSLVTIEANTANGNMGTAKRIYQINAAFSGDHIDANTDNAALSNDTLSGVQIQNTDENQGIVDKITLSWNKSTCAQAVTCSEVAITAEEQNAYSAYIDPSHPNKILICHNGNTLSVSPNAWNGHSQHAGDSLGACPSSQTVYSVCNDTDLSASQLADLNSCSVDSGQAKLKKITAGSEVLFEEGATPSSATTAVASGTEADVVNATVAGNSSFEFSSFQFDQAIPSGAWFTLNVKYADGSDTEQSFQVKSSQAPASTSSTASDVILGRDYDQTNGTVTVHALDDYLLDIKVIDSQITCGVNGPTVPVTADVAIDGRYQKLYQGKSVAAGKTQTFENLHEENAYIVKATAASKSCGNFSATYVSTNTTQVKTLVNGDAVPTSWAGFGGQQSVSTVLQAYIGSNGKIALAQNQVIMLFELGSKASTNSASVDFQDLVLLTTITKK